MKKRGSRQSLAREVRGALHAWRKYGRENAEHVWQTRFNWRDASSLERSLRGKIEHIIHIRGENDKATANLVDQFNLLNDRQYKDMSYSYSPANPLGILDSVCLIECGDDKNLVYGQGSGFVVEGGAVVTNFHVVTYDYIDEVKLEEPRIFPEIYVTFEKSEARYLMKVVYTDPKKDISIIRVEDSHWRPMFETLGCRLSFAPIERMDSVSIAGYPNHTPGASCRVYPGFVTGTAKHDGQSYFNVSQPIVKGNSGGPVFDKLGQVVGISTKGVDAADVINIAFNGCITINTLDRVILTDA